MQATEAPSTHVKQKQSPSRLPGDHSSTSPCTLKAKCRTKAAPTAFSLKTEILKPEKARGGILPPK